MEPKTKPRPKRRVAIFTGTAELVTDQVNRFLDKLPNGSASSAEVHLSSAGGETLMSATVVTVLVDFEATS
jgi:hypothetical protein